MAQVQPYASPWANVLSGSILVAQSARGICAILLGDDPDALTRELQDRFPQATLIGGDAAFEQLVATVVGFVEAPAVGLDLPLDIRGTAFQQRVWQALRTIPAGATASYTDIAKRIGAPQAVRAVAQACGANPLAVAIPCHRVVRHDGALAGIAGALNANAPCSNERPRHARSSTRPSHPLTWAKNAAERIKALDWERVSHDLDAQGSAMIERLLSPDECQTLAGLYPQDDLFRSRVVMGQHGFGRGEYKYFNYPLPELIAEPADGCLSAPCADRQSLEHRHGQ